MFDALTIGGLTVMYVIAYEGFRRCKLNSIWLIFGVLPLVLTPAWVWLNDFDVFLWIKMFSVFGGLCLAGWLKFGKADSTAMFRFLVPSILFVNVGEAMMVDLSQAGIQHLANAVAAISLMVTIPFGRRKVCVERIIGLNDLQFDLPRRWFVGYTLWNWSFVYLNYPAYTGHHTAVLLAALVVGCIRPKMWLQARSVTLGLNLLCYGTDPDFLLVVHDASRWTDCGVLWLAPFLSCAWILIASRINSLALPKFTQFRSLRGPHSFMQLTTK